MARIESITMSVSDMFESIWNILSYPNQLHEDAADSMLDLLHKYDLDPVYTITVFMNLIVLSYWGNFRKWNSQIPFIKQSAILAVVFAGIMNLWSLLKLLGVIGF